jgi:mannitol-1-phosphate/altronate dehydrogenase
MTILTGETLARLNAGVARPGYDRRQVRTGIAHLSVGNFHRSHQAVYIDTLMNAGAAMDWGICGIGLQPSNTAMRDVMAAQDGLYTLVIRHGDGTWEPRVIGSIVARLCANASDLIPKFVLPVIREQLAAGRPFTRAAAVVACWARYAEGTDESGEPHEMDDALAPRLRAAAGRQGSHPTAFLEDNREVFGDLADDTRFTRVYRAILAALHEHGVRGTLADLDRYEKEELP